MRAKIAPLFTAVAGCALLASCFGGGGNDSPTPAPTPSPSPSPTPTPTPTPTAVVFSFAQPFTATAANSSLIYAYFAPTGGAETWNDGAFQPGTATVTYAPSPESAKLAFPDGGATTTFAAADLTSSTATLRRYKKGTDGLAIEIPFTHSARATYDSFVDFTKGGTAGKLHAYRVSVFFNTVTTTAGISSNLSYTGTPAVAGGTPGTTPPGAFSADPATLTVTASDSKLTGSLRIYENVGGVRTLRATLPLNLTLNTTGGFTGTIADSTAGYSGTVFGSLAGPNREEIVFIFNVTASDGKEIIGSFLGD